MTTQFSSSAFRKVVQVGLMLMLLLGLMPATEIVSAAVKPIKCQCVVYIKNKYGLTKSAGSAKNMGPYLLGYKFVKLSIPRPNEIIIMKPSFGHGISSVDGHVAIISTVKDQGSTWRITVRGANQGDRPTWTESNCTNVSFWRDIVYPKSYGNDQVEYWGK